MKTWEELSLYSKTLVTGCVLFYIAVEKYSFLMKEVKETYNIMREDKLRRERLN